MKNSKQSKQEKKKNLSGNKVQIFFLFLFYFQCEQLL